MDKEYKTHWLDYVVIYIPISIIFFVLFFQACSNLNKMLGVKNDHVAEEFIEEIIEEKLDIDVDLTPAE